jgi:hypothetical protein
VDFSPELNFYRNVNYAQGSSIFMIIRAVDLE